MKTYRISLISSDCSGDSGTRTIEELECFYEHQSVSFAARAGTRAMELLAASERRLTRKVFFPVVDFEVPAQPVQDASGAPVAADGAVPASATPVKLTSQTSPGFVTSGFSAPASEADNRIVVPFSQMPPFSTFDERQEWMKTHRLIEDSEAQKQSGAAD